MNWIELKHFIESLTPEQLLTTVTVLVDDEYKGICGAGVAVDDDILDANHPVLVHNGDVMA